MDANSPFCASILQALVVFLEQSKLSVNSHAASNICVEVDEDEQAEARGMAVRNFRENLEDMFLQSYMLLRSTHGEEGCSRFQAVIVDALKSQDMLTIEACLFMLKSIEVSLKDDPTSISFVSQVFGQLLGPLSPMFLLAPNILLKRIFCQLLKETASFFTKMPELINPAIRVVLSLNESLVLANNHAVEGLNVSALETL